MEFGVYTFAETRLDPATGEPIGLGRTFNDLMEQIELADRVGLDVFGLGEHHRPDYAVSAPAVALAAGAARTKRIRLTSAVTVLSSDDPVRVYEQFATLDGLSGGRAEIMAGRGSFIESFPLFGYALDDYDELFAEKLDLLLAIRAGSHPVWKGEHRAPLDGRLGVYPRALQDPLPVWIASGGTPQSVARAGALGLPLAIAIIGGEPARFAPLAALYREAGRRAGVAPESLRARDQRPRLPRRHGGSGGRGLLRALRRSHEPPRPRARLAAAVAGAIRRRPRSARPPHGRHAGRGDRKNPRPARDLRPSAVPDADGGRRAAAGGDPALDRAVRDSRRAEGPLRRSPGAISRRRRRIRTTKAFHSLASSTGNPKPGEQPRAALSSRSPRSVRCPYRRRTWSPIRGSSPCFPCYRAKNRGEPYARQVGLEPKNDFFPMGCDTTDDE